MKPSLKYRLIEQGADRDSIGAMCKFYGVSRSGYYRYQQHKTTPAKDAFLAELIAECQSMRGRIHGYRYIQLWLEKNKGIHKDPKTVLRVMCKYGLLCEIRRKRWQGCGQAVHRYANILNRNFTAEHPNQKWVTDISYTPQHKAFYIFQSSVTCLTTALLLTKPANSRPLTLCWKPFVRQCKKKRSLGSYSSTATKGFNTLRRHTLP